MTYYGLKARQVTANFGCGEGYYTKKGFGWSEKYKYAKGRRLKNPALYGKADSSSTHSSGPQSAQLNHKVLKAALKDSNNKVWKTNQNHFKC